MLITKKSYFTGKEHTLEIPVTEKQLIKWQNGELIQNAMPCLTPAQREFLMTGATPYEWEELFETQDITL